MKPDAIIRGLLQLSTCDVSDALDRLKIRGAPLGILPLWEGCGRIAGPALTMKLVPGTSPSPVEGTLETIAAAQPGDILAIDHGGRLDANSWGGISAYCARRRDIAGVVIDGVSRDIEEMKAIGFPAYARGIIQQSVRGRCAFAGRGIEIRLAGIAVHPGDYLLADDNGLVVVPRQQVSEALRIAKECSEAERRVREEIDAGADPIEAHRRARYE